MCSIARGSAARLFDAITMGHDCEMEDYDRSDLIFTKEMLLGSRSSARRCAATASSAGVRASRALEREDVLW